MPAAMSTADAPSTALPTLTMREADARRVLLVQAFEEVDREGLLLAEHERSRATDLALARAAETSNGSGEAELLVHRAESLLRLLEERADFVQGLLRTTGFRPGFVLIVLPALVLGLLTNAIGPRGMINVLAFPLLGLILWNLAIYALLLVSKTRGGRGDGTRTRGLTERLADGYLQSAWKRSIRGRSEVAAVSAQAGSRFLAAWKRAATPLLLSRVRRALHIGALALVVGAVGGMYFRGLAFEFRATWESTFLTERGVQSILDVVLFPAREILRVELPALASIQPPEGGAAAPWIHLYAMTVVVFVIVPRTLLAIRETFRERALERALPIEASQAYFRRLLASGRGASVSVRILPYSYRPAKRATDNLRALLHDVFGARAEVLVLDGLEYGAEDTTSLEPTGSGGSEPRAICSAPVFALAQSPEIEVHGRFLESLKMRVGDHACLVVLVDGTAYRERMVDVPGGDDRLEERRRAWDRVIRETGLEPVHVELDRLPHEAVIARLARSVWPAGAPVGVA
ncbi:MAG: DUF2868 domain-containing protein [Planctomycetota bacterium]|nr:MAG: DUF2868 domain-containing protein [Planctomycetota bacterium]